MTRSAVAALNTVVLVVVGGLVAGHVISPYGAGGTALRRWSFVLLMLALGAARGARHARLAGRADRRAILRSAALGAAIVLGLALLAWWVVHGRRA